MVDVVDRAIAITNVDEHLEDVDDIRGFGTELSHKIACEFFLAVRQVDPVVEYASARLGVTADPAVEFHAAHGREVVAFRVEKQVVEQVFRSVLGGRLARTHHAIDFDQRLKASAGRVDAQGFGDVGTTVEVVGEQRGDSFHARIHQLVDDGGGQLFVDLGDDFASLGGNHVMAEHLLNEVLTRHGVAGDAFLLELADMTRGNATAFFADDLIARHDGESRILALQAGRNELHLHAGAGQVERVLLEEQVKNLLIVVAQRAQHDGNRQLAATVDTGEHAVLRVELKVEPRTAIRNDARLKQELARTMGLALVVVEEHAGATMQLGNDDALGAVHDERTVVRHQREFAEEHRLFSDVALKLLGAGGVLLINAQLHLHAQGRGIGEPAELALLDVEPGATEFVALEIEDCVPAVTGDREHALERRLQTRIVTTILMQVTLQEFLVGVQLDRQQVRHLQDARTLAEILADALLFCKGIGHLSHLCFCYWTLDS